MSKIKKQDLPMDFQVVARVGDAIVNTVSMVVEKECKGFKHKFPPHMSRLCNFLQSNNFLVKFNVPKTTFKRVPNQRHLRADKVEAYVGFLFINYGYRHAETYVKKQMMRILEAQV